MRARRDAHTLSLTIIYITIYIILPYNTLYYSYFWHILIFVHNSGFLLSSFLKFLVFLRNISFLQSSSFLHYSYLLYSYFLLYSSLNHHNFLHYSNFLYPHLPHRSACSVEIGVFIEGITVWVLRFLYPSLLHPAVPLSFTSPSLHSHSHPGASP